MERSNCEVSAAEQVRQEVRRKRMLRSQAPGTLPAPAVDSEFIADTNDMTVVGDALRAKDDLPAAFHFKIPAWPFSDPVENDTLKVYLDHSPAPFFLENYDPQDKPTFPLQIRIPQDALDGMGDGVKTFHYTVTAASGNVSSSADQTLIFDRVAPYQNLLPPKFADIPTVIDANKGQVKLELAEYSDFKPGDTVHVWWLKELPDPLPSPDLSVPVGALPQDLTVPLEVIERVKDGGVKVVYALADKARNYSSASQPLEVGVALGPWPTTFQAPQVELAVDGLIDQADVALDVQVHVPVFDNAKETDEVRVHWGSKSTAWRTVGEGIFPMPFGIDKSLIWEEYGGDTGVGDVPVTVTYEVKRGSVPLLNKGEKDFTFNVNLERIGPVDPAPDPDWPGPINGKLDPAEVYGAVSNTKNSLDASDADKPVKVVVPVDPAFKEGDVVTLFWRGEKVLGVEHEITSDDLGEELEMDIQWDVVAAGGNGTISMHYAIHRPGNPNGTQPKPTSVDVSGVVIRTDAPAFQGVTDTGYLNCQSIWSDPPHADDPALRVTVPDLAEVGFEIGNKVEMIWRATVYGTDQTIPVGFAREIELDTNNINGFVWRIPYEDYVLPIYLYDGTHTDANGYVSYKSVGTQTPIESAEDHARVSIHSAGLTCDISGP
ncbi:hypothetical protein [Pseudomonas putida]|uniref:hypothetical protein n=1 Tax=Pseudomonas putida TaxID=303 RepID=UPI001F522338|nr:hypothetical protein [Pseudomonas putida]MCI0910847.1 hypothetical protein [Pseudomonas putida]